MKDFELFQREFKKWQRRFGLSGYSVFFMHEEIGNSFAQIVINHSELVATVTLNNKLSEIAEPFKDIKGDGKHEAIHLLIGRLEMNGRCREVSSGEIFEASEELVNKLGNLI